MTQLSNPHARKYLRRVRSTIPYSRKVKMQIMENIQQSIGLYLEENPNADYKALLARFGEPEEIAAAYIETLEPAELLKKLRVRKRILTAVAAVLIIIVLLWTATIAYAIWKNHSTADGYVEVVVESL